MNNRIGIIGSGTAGLQLAYSLKMNSMSLYFFHQQLPTA
ncbi:hypothetical protein DFP97_10823 [Paenibacillus prosopidis]|uniref:Pyridine nucleotide-disulfide oxidoreductase n=1 Tax=Paenibacillus prosopidis TaxID=630520 RepID=A0A368VYR5_9BACL|nr:hypothetical protein DFP97_10823 [Paenibacillus prosopidis]